MLKQTFAHFPGVGLEREALLWACGFTSWEDILTRDLSACIPVECRVDARRSIEKLAAKDAAYFQRMLPSSLRWRSYPEFLRKAAFIDIETTGLAPGESYVTMVGVLHSDGYTAYIRHENLDELPAALQRYDLFVTYNGASFDLPFLRREFRDDDESGIFGNAIHIDLRYPLRRAGYAGGLKRIEKVTGSGRPTGLADLGGADAVTLWQMAHEGEPGAMPTLIRYNAEDVASLPGLARLAYDTLTSELPVLVPPAPAFPAFDTSSLPYDESLAAYLSSGTRTH